MKVKLSLALTLKGKVKRKKMQEKYTTAGTISFMKGITLTILWKQRRARSLSDGTCLLLTK